MRTIITKYEEDAVKIMQIGVICKMKELGFSPAMTARVLNIAKSTVTRARKKKLPMSETMFEAAKATMEFYHENYGKKKNNKDVEHGLPTLRKK